MKFVFFSVSENGKMDSVMKELREAMPPRIFGLQPPVGFASLSALCLVLVK